MWAFEKHRSIECPSFRIQLAFSILLSPFILLARLGPGTSFPCLVHSSLCVGVPGLSSGAALWSFQTPLCESCLLWTALCWQAESGPLLLLPQSLVSVCPFPCWGTWRVVVTFYAWKYFIGHHIVCLCNQNMYINWNENFKRIFLLV